MTLLPMKLVVSILVILNVRWDQQMQQVGKSNTSRYSVKIYEFSTFLNVIYVLMTTVTTEWGKGVSLHIPLHDT